MIKSKIHRMIHMSLCGLCLLLTGCSTATITRGSTLENFYENSAEEEPVDIYTSSASAVIESIDGKAEELTLHLIDRNESRVLKYDGTTIIEDKYGSAMSMAQLQSGDIVKIAYNSELQRLGRITLSEEAWSYEGIARYNLHAGNGMITIGEESYSIGRGVMAFSEGKPIEVAQIIHQDVLSFRGMGRNVMSITVDKGHGYLELENEDAVLGGWIEIGQTLISQIAPDMLFAVPEGSYKVRLTGTNVDEVREVTIERDRETKLDLSDIVIPVPDEGTVVFEITPKSADVYVDNEKVETTYPIKLSLGLHQVMAKASGYDSLAEYIKVEPETMTVKMELPKQEEDNLAESSASPGKGEEPETSQKGKITIEAPKDVDVYQDNLYMGVSPVTYEKTPGEHTITLRKTGYITRSYEIVVADDGQDVTYSFSELEPDDGRDSSPSPSISPSVSPSVSPSGTLTPTRTPTPTPTATPTTTPAEVPGGNPQTSPGNAGASGSPGTSPSGVPGESPSGSSLPSGEPMSSARPSWTPGVVPTKTPEPTKEPVPTKTPEPTKEPEPISTPEPTKEPEPIKTPEPTKEPEPISTPEPTEEPEPISTPEPTADGGTEGGEGNEGEGGDSSTGTGSEGDGGGSDITPGGSENDGTQEGTVAYAAAQRMFRRPFLVQEALILPLITLFGMKS